MKPAMIISGANGQVGSFLAKYFHDRGYPLILLYHKRNDRLQELMNAPLVHCEAVELEDPALVRQAIERGVEALKTIPGYLIHTASQRSYDALPLSGSDPEVWQAIFNSNLKGSYNLLRISLPYFEQTKFGRIVVFGSDITRSGLPMGSAYSAAKAALVNIVKSVAREVGGSNILINAISPGPIDTDLSTDYTGDYLQFRKEYFEKHKQACPTHKLVSKEEIRNMIDVLISAQNENITGEEIFINGGNR